MVDAKVKSLVCLGVAAALGACEPRQVDDAVPAPAPRPAAQPGPGPALPLGRAELIAAAAAAAGAHAVGVTPGEGDPTVGRSFSVRLPFGCGGPAAAEATPVGGLAQARWQSPEREAIVLSLTPADWTAAPVITGSGAAWEAVEGHWIDRPWLLEDRCPTVRVDPLRLGATYVEPPSVGLAAVHPEGGSRLGRRDGRAYRFVIRGPEGGTPRLPRDGFRVRLEGRIDSFPNGRAFRCEAPGPDARPICVAAVALDRVAFETADGAVLSEWRPR